MGKAIIQSVSPGTKTLVVTIVRDTSLLTTSKSNLEGTITSLDSRIAIQENSVTSQEIVVGIARTELSSSIAAEDPIELIRRNQETLIVSLTLLASLKTDLSSSRYQRINSTKQLEKVDVELTRAVDITNVVIPTADSGLSFAPFQEIGIAEIARQSKVGSTYIALPSEREDFDPTYSGPRDGIALPVLSEHERGWFYNSLIISASQIWKPRYWVALLLYKDDTANLGKGEGTIYVEPSTDLNNLPENNAIFINVKFDYETTHSRSFLVGNTVLIEFDVDRVPTIIGFANSDHFEAQPIAFHKFIRTSSLPAFEYRLTLDSLEELALIGIGETFPSWSGKSKGLEKLIPETFARGYSYFEQNAEPPFSSYNSRTTDSVTKYNVITLFGNSIDPLLTTIPVLSFKHIKSGGALVPLASTFADIFYKSGTSNNLHGNVLSGVTSLGATTSAPFLPITTISNTNILDADSPNANTQDLFVDGSFELSQPVAAPGTLPEPLNEYTKLLNLRDGQYLPTDYLFDDSLYVTPPAFNQFLTIDNYLSYIDGPLTESSNFFTLDPCIAYGLPPTYSSITPVPAAGSQNLMRWSENLFNGKSDWSGSFVISNLVSPANEPAGEVYMLQNLNNPPRYQGRHSDLLPSTQYTFSCRVRRNSYCNYLLRYRSNLYNSNIVVFDLIEGTAFESSGSFPVDNFGIVEEEEEWFRIFFVVTTTATVTTRVRDFQVSVSTLPTDNNNYNGMVLTNQQVTLGNGLQEYIKTTGTEIL